MKTRKPFTIAGILTVFVIFLAFIACDNETATTSVATPAATPAGGMYFTAQLQPVALSSATAGASIYYTLNGTTPNSSSTLYTGSPITIISSTVLKAIAVKDGMDNSGILTATYITVSKEDFYGTWVGTERYGLGYTIVISASEFDYQATATSESFWKFTPVTWTESVNDTGYEPTYPIGYNLNGSDSGGTQRSALAFINATKDKFIYQNGIYTKQP